MKLWVCTTKEFLHKLSETSQGSSSACCALDLTSVLRHNRLQWANVLLRWPLAHWISVDESQFQLYRADGRRRVGKRFADVNVLNRLPDGGVGSWYGQA